MYRIEFERTPEGTVVRIFDRDILIASRFYHGNAPDLTLIEGVDFVSLSIPAATETQERYR